MTNFQSSLVRNWVDIVIPIPNIMVQNSCHQIHHHPAASSLEFNNISKQVIQDFGLIFHMIVIFPLILMFKFKVSPVFTTYGKLRIKSFLLKVGTMSFRFLQLRILPWLKNMFQNFCYFWDLNTGYFHQVESWFPCACWGYVQMFNSLRSWE